MGINDFIAATVRRALPDSISSQIMPRSPA